MMAPLREELKDLKKREIITPVERSTDRTSSMVSVTRANGKPRICIDPKPLSRAPKRSHFPLPTIDDILPELSKAKVFAVCDVQHGFWHIKLDEKSTKYEVFCFFFAVLLDPYFLICTNVVISFYFGCLCPIYV